MSETPDRLLTKVVLAALAVAGFLVLAAVTLLSAAAIPAKSRALAFFCLIAPVSSTDTAVHASAVVAVALIVLAVLAAVRTLRRERSTVAELCRATRQARSGSPSPSVHIAASQAGVFGLVDVVAADRSFAFAYGWLRPRICVSTGLIDRLTEPEIAAVLYHEGWHVTRRDPLRLLLVRTVVAAFAIIPPIRRLAEIYLLAVEVAADAHVVAAMGDPRWLAGALVKVTASPLSTPAFEGCPEARIAALVGERLPVPTWWGRVAAAVIVLELVALAPFAMGGNVPLLAAVWTHPIC